MSLATYRPKPTKITNSTEKDQQIKI